MLGDITSLRLLWIKFALFIFLGLFAVTLALLLFPDVKLAVLMAVAIWAFCRAYYFTFYVVEKYADPSFKFAGLGSFLRYALMKRKRNADDADSGADKRG
ncbi:hypothetical protein [Limnoglobus roseus]|uniref:Uncharacterized protein n=1 Tax=Limnoglobus roseus TaxID=2598579 RepID=A0A5C1A5D9_9BACT|nr:hypothetical protein [Limnoglobus roseus]QEL13563.1 hypothetical protein PX52LOC_00421 [Limnoglobus roseus]